MRILIVDDQTSIRSLIKEILHSMEVTDIAEASNGAIALHKLRTSPPFNLLICDWYMPEMTGVELIKQIRSDPQLFPLRVLMLTSEQSRENILTVAALKIQGYVVKPFKPDTLVKGVTGALLQPPPTLIPADAVKEESQS